VKVYVLRAFHFQDFYASIPLAAQALDVPVSAITDLTDANVALGKAPFPIAAEVSVTLGGTLAGLRTPPTVLVTMDEIDVRESLS
jgi:hypothetical protein